MEWQELSDLSSKYETQVCPEVGKGGYQGCASLHTQYA